MSRPSTQPNPAKARDGGRQRFAVVTAEAAPEVEAAKTVLRIARGEYVPPETLAAHPVEPFDYSGTANILSNTADLLARPGVLKGRLDDAAGRLDAETAARVRGSFEVAEAELAEDAARPWGPPRIGAASYRPPFPTRLEFPLDAFPAMFARLAEEGARAIKCPVDCVAASGFGVAAAAIGQSVNVLVKQEWTESPQFFIACVGGSGWAKSPAVRLVVRVLMEVDRLQRLDHAKALETWEAADPKLGPRPVARRTMTGDITRESLALLLHENSRGVLCYQDELTAWMNGMDQYRAKGTDRQFWLSIWSSTAISVDRKGGRESYLASRPLANVVGGMTPAMLGSLREERGRDDGFLNSSTQTGKCLGS